MSRKSLSRVSKNPMTNGERHGFFATCPPLFWQVWPKRSIILLGGRWAAWTMNCSDLWPTFASQKLIILNLCRGKMLCKSTMKALCRQKRVILQVCEHMLYPFDLYGHPRAFIWAKTQKPSFHCKQMVLLTRKVKNSFIHSPTQETWRRSCFKNKLNYQTLPLPIPHRLKVTTYTLANRQNLLSILSFPLYFPILSQCQILHSFGVDTINIKWTNSIPNHEGAFLCMTTI